jgi:hypothetical protein
LRAAKPPSKRDEHRRQETVEQHQRDDGERHLAQILVGHRQQHDAVERGERQHHADRARVDVAHGPEDPDECRRPERKLQDRRKEIAGHGRHPHWGADRAAKATAVAAGAQVLARRSRLR